MHDSLLLEKTYQTVRSLCVPHAIQKINEITLLVSRDSHLEPAHMLAHLIERDSTLFGDWTTVTIQKGDIEKLTLMVLHIDGEQYA